MLCDYGCGQEANYQLKNGKWCCCKRVSSCPAIRKKNSLGVLKFNVTSNRDYKLQYQKLSQDVKDRMVWNKGLTVENNLSVKKGVDSRKKSFIEGKWCGYWRGRKHTPEEIDKIAYSMNQTLKVNKSVKYKRGWKYNIHCDSRLELIFVIYHIEHGDIVERNYKGYDYIYENKPHRYYPDFRLNGKLVEIKGYHTDIVDIKLASVDEDIKILYPKDLQYCRDYIWDKYNVRYSKCEILYDI